MSVVTKHPFVYAGVPESAAVRTGIVTGPQEVIPEEQESAAIDAIYARMYYY